MSVSHPPPPPPADGEEVGADGGSADSDDGMSCDGDAGGAGPAAADDSASDGEAGDAAETATVSEAPVDDDKYDRDMDMEEEEATLRRIKGRSLNHWKRYKTTVTVAVFSVLIALIHSFIQLLIKS